MTKAQVHQHLVFAKFALPAITAGFIITLKWTVAPVVYLFGSLLVGFASGIVSAFAMRTRSTVLAIVAQPILFFGWNVLGSILAVGGLAGTQGMLAMFVAYLVVLVVGREWIGSVPVQS